MNPLWKEDDRRWFERNPSRSHRIRRAYIGEMESLGFDPKGDDPPLGTERFAIVRQHRPGLRTRRFARLEPAKFPLENECAAHALFDMLVETHSGRRGAVSNIDTVALLARAAQYAAASVRSAS